VFWAATLTEFFAAVDGWAVANGAKPKADPPSRKRLDELKQRYG
jgi:hypothetical protein